MALGVLVGMCLAPTIVVKNVYRGKALTESQDLYIFNPQCSAGIRSLNETTVLTHTLFQLTMWLNSYLVGMCSCYTDIQIPGVCVYCVSLTFIFSRRAEMLPMTCHTSKEFAQPLSC